MRKHSTFVSVVNSNISPCISQCLVLSFLVSSPPYHHTIANCNNDTFHKLPVHTSQPFQYTISYSLFLKNHILFVLCILASRFVLLTDQQAMSAGIHHPTISDKPVKKWSIPTRQSGISIVIKKCQMLTDRRHPPV